MSISSISKCDQLTLVLLAPIVFACPSSLPTHEADEVLVSQSSYYLPTTITVQGVQAVRAKVDFGDPARSLSSWTRLFVGATEVPGIQIINDQTIKASISEGLTPGKFDLRIIAPGDQVIEKTSAVILCPDHCKAELWTESHSACFDACCLKSEGTCRPDSEEAEIIEPTTSTTTTTGPNPDPNDCPAETTPERCEIAERFEEGTPLPGPTEIAWVDGAHAACPEEGDGSYDSPYCQIQYALDNDMREYVLIRPAIYRESLNLHKPCTLVGVKDVRIIGSVDSPAVRVTTSGVSVRSLEIEAQDQKCIEVGENFAQVSLNRLTIGPCIEAGIEARLNAKVTIRNTQISGVQNSPGNTDGYGIDSDDFAILAIHNVEISDVDRDGVHVGFDGNLFMSHAYIHDARDDGLDFDAAALGVVQNSTFSDCLDNGVDMDATIAVTIENSLISGNQTVGLRVGANGTAILRDSEISGHIAPPAMSVDTDGTLTVERSKIWDNPGGGLNFRGKSLTFFNNIVARNGNPNSSTGGALLYAGSPTLPGGSAQISFSNNTFVDNQIDPGLGKGAALYCQLIGQEINNSIFWDISYNAFPQVTGCELHASNLQNPAEAGPGATSIQPLDPKFVSETTGPNAYHLQPDSPNRNAAFLICSPLDDIDQDPRPLGSTSATDIGADEIP